MFQDLPHPMGSILRPTLRPCSHQCIVCHEIRSNPAFSLSYLLHLLHECPSPSGSFNASRLGPSLYNRREGNGIWPQLRSPPGPLINHEPQDSLCPLCNCCRHQSLPQTGSGVTRKNAVIALGIGLHTEADHPVKDHFGLFTRVAQVGSSIRIQESVEARNIRRSRHGPSVAERLHHRHHRFGTRHITLKSVMMNDYRKGR
mmetsp:Transcript_42594/g.129281  ORF Transcript_42594/g.129281 Transcript_42594/m.129281 type:complete len:201 (+) Transcript_42594:2364-2966(+)